MRDQQDILLSQRKGRLFLQFLLNQRPCREESLQHILIGFSAGNLMIALIFFPLLYFFRILRFRLQPALSLTDTEVHLLQSRDNFYRNGKSFSYNFCRLLCTL